MPRHEQHRPHHNDGCDSQTQKALGRAYRHTHSQLGIDLLSLETIDAAIKLTLECANLIERAYLTMALKVFLQTIGKRKGCRVLLRGMRLLDACSQKQRRKRTGMGQRADAASLQSNANIIAANTSVEAPMPKICGIVCENRRS